jgi:hypothetical protein
MFIALMTILASSSIGATYECLCAAPQELRAENVDSKGILFAPFIYLEVARSDPVD